MIFAFLSARLRRWFLLVVVLPLVGRILQALGIRVAGRNPRAARVLGRAGGHLRGPQTDPRALPRRRRGWRPGRARR